MILSLKSARLSGLSLLPIKPELPLSHLSCQAVRLRIVFMVGVIQWSRYCNQPIHLPMLWFLYSGQDSNLQGIEPLRN